MRLMSDRKYPSYPVFRLWTLKALKDGEEYTLSDLWKHVANLMDLSEAQRNRKLSSGKSAVQDRVQWARYKLRRSGLITYPFRKRGGSQITKAGMRCLKKASNEGWTEISDKQLQEWSLIASTDDDGVRSNISLSLADRQKTCSAVQDDRAKQLLDWLQRVTPESFERIVLDLLRAMGYGQGDVDESEVTGGPGDGGIDGWIRKDALGLDKIYMQAKRYDEKTVGPQEVRGFIGALGRHEGAKGVFVTTSRFTASARKEVDLSPKNIALIDGEKFALLMLQYRVGVIRKGGPIYIFDEIDESYFSEDEKEL